MGVKLKNGRASAEISGEGRRAVFTVEPMTNREAHHVTVNLLSHPEALDTALKELRDRATDDLERHLWMLKRDVLTQMGKFNG